MSMGNLPAQIAGSISNQEDRLLRTGQPPRDRFDTLRQRGIWSTYHLVNGTGLAIVQDATTGNVPVLRAGTYRLFVTDAGAQGQGLPSGLTMDQLDTDFIGSGRVPDQQNFAVWEVGVSVLEQRRSVVELSPATRGAGQPNPDDVDQILTNGVLRIKAISQIVPLGHLADFAEPGGPRIAVPSMLDYTGNAVAAAGPPTGGVGGMSVGSVVDQPWSLGVPRLSTNGGSVTASPGARRRLRVPIFLPAQTQFEFQLSFKRPVLLRSLENGGTAGFRVRVDLWVAESYRPNS